MLRCSGFALSATIDISLGLVASSSSSTDKKEDKLDSPKDELHELLLDASLVLNDPDPPMLLFEFESRLWCDPLPMSFRGSIRVPCIVGIWPMLLLILLPLALLLLMSLMLMLMLMLLLLRLS
jgi:hypothetical protein